MLVVAVANNPLVPARRWRARLLRSAGVDARGWATVYSGIRVAGESRVTLGDPCFVNHGVYFDASAPITIGDRVAVGDHVRFITSTHEVGPREHRAGRRSGAPVVIGDGCWLGSGVVVLPGVTVGAGCVIGAGSVVTRDCETDGLYVGNPARRIRDLP
jgi:acetyltransferase-like isoleucine patch superfamily enzyme